jgi:hypothetical protein
MQARLQAFQASVKLSAVQESQCAAPPNETSIGAAAGSSDGGIMPACDTPLKDWGVTPTPPVPSPTFKPFKLRADGGACLTAVAASERATVTMAPCITAGVQNWKVDAAGDLFLTDGTLYVKPNYAGRSDRCAAGAAIWLGDNQKNMFRVSQNGSIRLDLQCKAPMCLVVAASSSIGGGGSSGGLSLGLCSDPGAQGWARTPV